MFFIHSLSLKKYQQNNFGKKIDFNHIIRCVKYKILVSLIIFFRFFLFTHFMSAYLISLLDFKSHIKHFNNNTSYRKWNCLEKKRLVQDLNYFTIQKRGENQKSFLINITEKKEMAWISYSMSKNYKSVYIMLIYLSSKPVNLSRAALSRKKKSWLHFTASSCTSCLSLILREATIECQRHL